MRILYMISVCLFTSVISGCAPGFIYTHITVPVSVNMKYTPVRTKRAEIKTNQLKEPFTGLGISAEWNSRAIGDAVKKIGLKNIYYADMEILSILGGIWREQKILVKGD